MTINDSNTFVHKAEKNGQFTQINNSLLRDSTISYEARGVMALILSYPSDWKVRKSTLAIPGKDGRTVIDRIFKELEEHYYLRTVKVKSSDGKFAGIEYHFYEDPHENPAYQDTADSSAVCGKPACGEPATTNTILNNTVYTNTSFIDKDYINTKLKNTTSERSSEKDNERVTGLVNKKLTDRQYEKLLSIVPDELVKHIGYEDGKYRITRTFIDMFIESSKSLPLVYLSEFLDEDDTKIELKEEVKNTVSVDVKESVQETVKNTEPATPKKKNTRKTNTSAKAEKKVSPGGEVKKHYLENVKNLNEQGKTNIVMPVVNSAAINSRLKDLIVNQGISVEQINCALDYAMTKDWHVYQVGYNLTVLLSTNVISKLLNDPECKPYTPPTYAVKKPNFQYCKKCGERLNGFGRCTWCDED